MRKRNYRNTGAPMKRALQVNWSCLSGAPWL